MFSNLKHRNEDNGSNKVEYDDFMKDTPDLEEFASKKISKRMIQSSVTFQPKSTLTNKVSGNYDPDLCYDRLSVEIFGRHALDDEKQYRYQPWNHLEKFEQMKTEPHGIGEEPAAEENEDFFNEEEQYLKQCFAGMEDKYLMKGVSLEYSYIPEHCFNNMLDVIDMKHRTNPLDHKHVKEIPTSRQFYNPRLFSSKSKDIMENEFPSKESATRGSKKEFNQKNPTPHRTFKSNLKSYSSYLKEKKCFPIGPPSHSEDELMLCLEPSEEFRRRLARRQPEDLPITPPPAVETKPTTLLTETALLNGDEPDEEPEKLRENNKELDRINVAYTQDLVDVDRKLLLEKEYQRYGTSRFEPEDFAEGIIEKDKELEKVEVMNWSGEQIFSRGAYGIRKTKKVVHSLNDQNLVMWMSGIDGLKKYLSKRCEIIVDHPMTKRFIFICVIVNIIIMMLTNLTPPNIDTILIGLNIFFTVIFVLELILKLIAMGIRNYVRSVTNMIDGTVTIACMLEITIELATKTSVDGSVASGGGNFSILKVLRVLLLVEDVKNLRFMGILSAIIMQTAGKYIMVAILLVIVMFVFLLFGMQVYAGNLIYSNTIPRHNFDTILAGFLTLLQLLTRRNWIEAVETLFNSSISHSIAIFYVLAWIIIGNYIIFNLFLASLLGGFESPEVIQKLKESKDEFLELEEIIKKKVVDKQKKAEDLKQAKEIEHYEIEYILKGESTTAADEKERQMVLSKEEQERRATYYLNRELLGEEESSEEDELLLRILDKLVRPKPEELIRNDPRHLYRNLDCKASLYLFRKETKFRLLCTRIISHRW